MCKLNVIMSKLVPLKWQFMGKGLNYIGEQRNTERTFPNINRKRSDTSIGWRGLSCHCARSVV